MKETYREAMVLITAAAGISVVFLFVSAVSASEELSPGECIVIPVWNSTLNMTQNDTICAQNVSQPTYCNLDLDITQNGSYDYSDGACNVSLDINVSTVTQTVYDQSCYIRETIHSGGNYTNTEGPCNVMVSAGDYWCPACPQQQTCDIEDTIYPEGNVTWYKNDSGACNIDLRIGECDQPLIFNMPPNYSAIPNSELERSGRAIDLYADCAEKLSTQRYQLNVTSMELAKIEDSYCPIDDHTLLTGWEKMANFEKKYLDYFIMAQSPVDYLAFSELIMPNGTGNEKLNVDFYAGMALETYQKIGFAKPVCEVYYDQHLARNTTICFYEPVVNAVCLNKTASLTEIKKEGRQDGQNTTAIMGGIGVFTFFCLLMLAARSPFMPYR